MIGRQQQLLNITRKCSNSIKVVSKTAVICVKFLRDIARQKLLKSTNVSQSYSNNNTGTVFFTAKDIVQRRT